jgi:transcriptional regulator with XRE-family HTH domain
MGKVNSFGSFLRYHRERQEISLRELADGAGISPSYLSIVERDMVGAPSDEVIIALEDALTLRRGTLAEMSDHVPREIVKILSRRPVLREIVVLYAGKYSDEELQEILRHA